MSVLELRAKLKNVSKTCRRREITRTQFYEYKNVLRLSARKAWSI